MAATRKDVAILKTSLARIRDVFMMQGTSLGLENLPALVDKDPAVGRSAGGDPRRDRWPRRKPTLRRQAMRRAVARGNAQQALAAIAEYYSRLEPSSPTLPLVRQAHQLIGKSFFEVMSILVPQQNGKRRRSRSAPTSSSSCRSTSCPSSREGTPRAGRFNRCHPDLADRRNTASIPARRRSRCSKQVQRFFRHSEALQPGADAMRSCTCPRRTGFHGRAEGGASEGRVEDVRRRKMRSMMSQNPRGKQD